MASKLLSVNAYQIEFGRISGIRIFRLRSLEFVYPMKIPIIPIIEIYHQKLIFQSSMAGKLVSVNA